MSLLIAFQNLLFKKITFLNETKRPLCHRDFDYQEKYIDALCRGGFARKNSHED